MITEDEGNGGFLLSMFSAEIKEAN